VFPALVYLLFGSSRHLGVGPSPLVCLLTGATASSWCSSPAYPTLSLQESYVGNCDEEAYITLVRQFALVQGAALLLLGVFQAGFFLRFFSAPILVGFLSASAVIITPITLL
jgi:MFS superfamily sulfate permease-like transporter